MIFFFFLTAVPIWTRIHYIHCFQIFLSIQRCRVWYKIKLARDVEFMNIHRAMSHMLVLSHLLFVSIFPLAFWKIEQIERNLRLPLFPEWRWWTSLCRLDFVFILSCVMSYEGLWTCLWKHSRAWYLRMLFCWIF